MQRIFNNRPSDRTAVLQTIKLRPFFATRLGEDVLGDPAGVLIGDEHVAAQVIGARTRDRGDDGGRRLLVLGFEVLGQHPKLLHSGLGEGIPTAVVLTGDAAVVDQRLLVLAVDKDVNGAGRLPACGDGALRVAFRHADARRQGRKVQEVAVDLGQIIDLLLADACPHFRRTDVKGATTDNDDFADVRGGIPSRGQVKV